MITQVVWSPGAGHPLALHVPHQPSLVLLSLLVALGCSAGAFYMAAAHRRSASAFHRHISLLCACLVMGFGVWAMHFIGMLAMRWPVPMTYDRVLTSLSIVPAIVTAGVALHTMRVRSLSAAHMVASGCLVGLGIAAMHYSGLAALQGPARLEFAAGWLAVSLALGVLLAVAAFQLQVRKLGLLPPWKSWRVLVLPPLLLTAAIVTMHYLSMQAMRLVPDAAAAQAPDAWKAATAPALALQIGASALVLMLLLGCANAMLRYRDLWQALAARDARLRAMVDTAVDGVISINAQGLIQAFNPAAERLFGWKADEVLQRNVSLLMPSPLAEQHDGHLRQHVGQPEKPIQNNGREVLGQHKDGHLVPLQLNIGKAQTPSGTLFVAYLTDISHRKRTDAQLRIAASVFEHVREGVAIVDANHNISTINPAFARLMDVTLADCTGRPLEELYEACDAPLDSPALWNTVASQQYWQTELSITRHDGTEWLQRLSISPVLNEHHRPQHFIAVVSDVSVRPLPVLHSPPPGLLDHATHLANHQLLLDRLGASVLHARRTLTPVGVLCITLHEPAADSHCVAPSADLLALHLAPQLQALLRSTDLLARPQPDQLVVVLAELKDEAALAVVCQRLRAVLQAPLQIQGQAVQAASHLGCACYPQDGSTPAMLLAHAHHQRQALHLPTASEAAPLAAKLAKAAGAQPPASTAPHTIVGSTAP